MSYGTRIVGGTVEVISPRTGTVYSYEIPPGTSPAAYSLRCAERARVSECLAAIRVTSRRGASTRRFKQSGA
jgi:streptogramin lyase